MIFMCLCEHTVSLACVRYIALTFLKEQPCLLFIERSELLHLVAAALSKQAEQKFERNAELCETVSDSCA